MTTTTPGLAVKSGEKSLAASSPLNDERYTLESQIRECFGRCAYSHKTHEKMAERCSTRLKHIKLLQIALSGLTTAGAVGVVFDRTTPFYAYATMLLATSVLIVNSYMKDIDPGQAAQKHREAASDIWNIREGYLSLLTDIREPTFSMDLLRKRRDELQTQLHKIYRIAPHTNAKAYGEAQDALKNEEDLTFSEKEIDAFLPEPLKRTNTSS